MRIFSSFFIYISCAVMLAACTAVPSRLNSSDSGPRKIAVFFDGTANDPSSDTNIRKLHSIVSLQSNPAIATFYIEGVGAQGKAVGMGMGWGFGDRVRKAYTFLQEEYRENDEIYIFGFSRGAYSARALAALLYYAGIPKPVNNPEFSENKQIYEERAALIYDAFKGEQIGRRERIQNAMHQNSISDLDPVPVHVKVLGLWDTVEALGIPDYKEEFKSPNHRYGDQLCNVEKAYHAVSIDDDRARIFTPILLTWPHLLEDCQKNGIDQFPNTKAKVKHLNAVVEEVYFAGAHADIGGGYPDSLLSGVSLNWMLKNLSGTGLLPSSGPVQVREDAFGPSHDPEHGYVWGLLYHRQARNLIKHLTNGEYLYNGGRLKIHKSALDRLDKCEKKTCQHADHEFPWASWPGECFKQEAGRYLVDWNRLKECRIDTVL